MRRTIRILGTRGVPAAHGGFETAAENIGLELVRRGWRVIVYCQSPDAPSTGRVDEWRGIERVHLPDRFKGPLGTIWFDALAMRHAARHRDLCLTFGYNTAFLNEALRVRKVPVIINMDGVEWRRARWSPAQRQFLHLNERLACRIGDHLIADHPEIERHLREVAPRAAISTITYGAPLVEAASTEPVRALGLEPGGYLTVIARPVAENSILEVVSAFSRRRRGVRLVVLGTYDADVEYHRAVLDAAGPEVTFAGAIYDTAVVDSLRFHSRAYVHGHTVGGTNPSLVEALGCGNPVIAHDNPFNRWVAQDAGSYAADEDGFDKAIDQVLADRELATQMSRAAYRRHAEAFEWSHITDQYEALLEQHLPRGQVVQESEIPRQRRPVSASTPAPARESAPLAVSRQLVEPS